MFEFGAQLTADALPDKTTGTGADRRGAPRHPAEQIPHIAARLTGPGDVRLIDLSRTGARFQSERRFLPNATIALRLVTVDGTLVVSGQVVRSRIVTLTRGGLGYDVAIAFSAPLSQLLEEAPNTPEVDELTTEPAGPADAEAPDALPQVTAGEEVELPTSPGATGELTVTATVPNSKGELQDIFNGNHW
jgi:hypothetical protein